MVEQSQGEVTFLIRAIVDACERRGVPLSKIRVGQTLGSNAKPALGPEPLKYEGIPVELVEDLEQRIEFYRFPKSSDAG